MEQRGFTLVELLAVILIVAVISIGVSSRFSNATDFQTLATRDDIVAGLFYAQQIAIARAGVDGTVNQVQFVCNGNTIDVREGNPPVSIANDNFPLNLPGGTTLNCAPNVLSYDKLGQTTPAVITLTSGGSSVTINVSGTGYAR